jgi:hypothetical protein
MADETFDPRRVMTQGYLIWNDSEPVKGLMAFLRAEFPDASELELRNHVLSYTLVKLVVWLQPDSDDDKPKEPWEM